jgi:hypothetical protein
MHLITRVVCSLWVASLLLEKIVTGAFLSRLRRLHGTTWGHLGEPATMMPTLRFLGFLWRRGYDSLPDEQIVVIGRQARLVWICQTILWVAMIWLVILSAYQHWPELRKFAL